MPKARNRKSLYRKKYDKIKVSDQTRPQDINNPGQSILEVET